MKNFTKEFFLLFISIAFIISFSMICCQFPVEAFEEKNNKLAGNVEGEAVPIEEESEDGISFFDKQQSLFNRGARELQEVRSKHGKQYVLPDGRKADEVTDALARVVYSLVPAFSSRDVVAPPWLPSY